MVKALLTAILTPLLLLGFLMGYLYQQIAAGFQYGKKVGERFP